jgi:hypothetical protein
MQVRHEGDIDLVPNSRYDLDSIAPDWGQGSSGTDITGFGSGEVLAVFINPFPAFVKLSRDAPEQYATCRGATGLQSNVRVDRDEIRPGDRWCIRTGQDRYSYVVFKSVSASVIKIHATTWEKEQ